MNLPTFRGLVREITGVWSSDQLTDIFLNFLVNETLGEIYRKHGSGWPFAQTFLSNDTATVGFDSQFQSVVVYRTAAKVLQYVADTTPRRDMYLQEYQLVLSDMEKFYLSGYNNLSLTGVNGINDLIAAVRGLTGIYDTYIMTDSFLTEIINVAYTEIKNVRDWNHWRFFTQNALSAYPFYENNPWGPSHAAVLYDSMSTEDIGDGREVVTGAWIVTQGKQGRVKRMIRKDSLADIDDSDDNVYYAIVTDHEADQVYFCFAPEQQDNDTYIRLSGVNPVSRIDSIYNPETGGFTSTFLEFAPQFQMILPYRAAQFVLMQLSPEDTRIAFYEQQYSILLDAMITFDQLNHDTATFSLGERGKDSPRYVPWFKPA